MFTGIIEEVGTVTAIERGEASARFTVAGETVVSDASLGDSITINGVCLTVVERKGHETILRKLAVKWIKIAYHLWRTGQYYNEELHIDELKKRNVVWAMAL